VRLDLVVLAVLGRLVKSGAGEGAREAVALDLVLLILPGFVRHFVLLLRGIRCAC
jgi:hypothetical protein